MNKELIRVEHLRQYFSVAESSFRQIDLKAVDDVSFSIQEGETLGLVGESGCGKSTLGRTILGLNEATSGDIFYDGVRLDRKIRKQYRTSMQMIFQDPYSSLNPRMTVEDLIAEPMKVLHMFDTKKEVQVRVQELMDTVGLRRDYKNRYPHEFSGGQRQRIGIARALATKPGFIVCDEPVSALDVSVKAQVINMFMEIKKKQNVSFLFITHDLLTARYISDRIAVMYLGKIVEIGTAEQIFEHPKHPYTKVLLSAISIPDPDANEQRKRIPLTGEVPSPMNVPTGCAFHNRCPYKMDCCEKEYPPMKVWQQDECEMGQVACFLESGVE